eukprot:CAMPEP_0204831304 /NCGR_PEP_ID=MMETSP1346-20131115/10347_1 /ASSEMBLY_ACC=CAM_ASM_000771 /TAXON_ID=215587 /ORGANISM="Aplanochytrium stocchinoi, Strain GSBS06" /LENGTH=227 /DNA_ID=CAMNT_0051962237 /DNA_START=132 /DNA_END=815 /DNA_ORIENTATION=+
MLRFEDRNFGKALLDVFHKDWVDAKRDLDNENYNRHERLEQYYNKPDKSFVYFQRKSVQELLKSLRTKSVTSIAHGKIHPRLARDQIKRQQAEAIKAAGNKHLAHTVEKERDIDSDSDSGTESDDVSDLDSEYKHNSSHIDGRAAVAKRKDFKRQYKGQNHKKVPEDYRQSKVNRDLMIARAKRQGKPIEKYAYAKRSFTSMPTMKDQRHLRRSVKWCAVDMIEKIE